MPLNIDFQQILLHMLNLAILFGALYFLLYAPVKKFMDRRNDKVDEALADAAKKTAEAEQARLGYEAKCAELERREAELNGETLEKARLEADKIRSDAKKDAERILQENREKAKKEYDAFLNEARQNAAELAEEAARRVVYGDSSDAMDVFLDESEAQAGERRK